MRPTILIALAVALSATDANAQANRARPGTDSTAAAGKRDTTVSSATAGQHDTATHSATPTRHNAGDTLSLSETVLDANDRPVAGARVTATNLAGLPRATIDSSDERGRYQLDSLGPGAYDVRIAYGDRNVRRTMLVPGAPGAVIRLPRPGWQWTEALATLICLIVYLLSIANTRWHHIARAQEKMASAQLRALKTRLDTEVEGCVSNKASNELRQTWQAEADALAAQPDAADADARRARLDTLEREVKVAVLREALAELQKDITLGSGWSGVRNTISEFVFWSRGRENAVWTGIHEIERELAAFLAPPEYVESYLRWADAELRAIGKPAALAVANAIHLELQRSSPEAPEAGKRRKALLGRGISIIYAERDNSFSTLMEWQNKASWLTFAAIVIIAFLSIGAGHSVLFLAGAAGGFLSRLMRALKRTDVPLDYGASWTTLYLSPLFGALAGWFGVALIGLATQPGINLLGEAFRSVRWDEPYEVSALAAAFLLGFSERFFDAVVGALDQHASSRTPASQAPPVLPHPTDGHQPAGGDQGQKPGGDGGGGAQPNGADKPKPDAPPASGEAAPKPSGDGGAAQPNGAEKPKPEAPATGSEDAQQGSTTTEEPKPDEAGASSRTAAEHESSAGTGGEQARPGESGGSESESTTVVQPSGLANGGNATDTRSGQTTTSEGTSSNPAPSSGTEGQR
jgi:protocatechuate 3,4-dioxygenase beta subunit